MINKKHMKQRFTLIIILLFLFGVSIYSQKVNKKTSVGVFYSVSGASLENLEQSSSLSFSVKNCSGVGVNVVHNLGRKVLLESGLEYTLLDLKQIQTLPADTVQTNLSLLEIPILGRFYFSQNIFVNGGLLFDFDMNSTSVIASQTGLGLTVGLGAVYNFNSVFSIYANPYVKAHTLLSFNSFEQKENFVEYGIRLGVAYRL